LSTAIAAASVSVATAQPGAGRGVSAPPPFASEAIPIADGPVVAEADPFTLTSPGLLPGQIEMTTVSTRPSLVAGDRVRVEVRGLSTDDVLRVARDGQDITAAFAPVPGRPSARQGAIGGLHPGPNTVVATASGGSGVRTTSLVVVDHPIAGPVISGAHQEPFICETAASGMSPPTDADCSAPTQFHWYARSAVDGRFRQLSDPYAPYPTGTATTTAGGHTAPFVVRVESAVINRSITHIAVLDDPHAGGPQSPFAPREWNARLLYVFGESCGTGHHQGVVHETDVLGDPNALNENYALAALADLPGRLGQGYMVALSSLTTLGVHCNPLLTGETLTMVKQHIIDDYGAITHTIGAGGSGGAIQQYTTANSYPGLIDAATPIVSFPDTTTTGMAVMDCYLLDRVFASDTMRWNAVKETAVTGMASPRVCQDWDSEFFPVLIPSNCPSGIPPAQVYDARRNPHGVRCDVQDGQRVIWGIDPVTGFANRALDNVGVQYGLLALRQGVISADDFIELNRGAGGLDIDANPISTRTAMPGIDAQIAFASGAATGRGALDEIPIIDQSAPAIDFTPDLDIHDQVRPFQIRARLDATFGSHANQAIWSGGPLPQFAIDVAEEWLEHLDAYSASHPGASRAEAVVQSRPADAADQCRVGVAGVPGACDQGVVRHASPRQAGGGPLAEDVIKCRLQPVDARDYPANVTPAQLAEIRSIFPDGVCDWSQQSVGAQPRSQTWLSWSGGEPGTTPVTIPYPLVRSAGTGVAGTSNTPAAALPALVGLANTGGTGAAGPISAAALLGCGVGGLLLRLRRRRSLGVRL